MNRRDRIRLFGCLIPFLLSSCGDFEHSIGQIQVTDSGAKDAAVDAKASGQKEGADSGQFGSGGNGNFSEAGAIENEGGLDASIEAGVSDSAVGVPDGGCVSGSYKPRLDIYMMMDTALAFSIPMPTTVGSTSPVAWAKDEMSEFLENSSNQQIGVGIKFYGKTFTCKSSDYRKPDVENKLVSESTSNGKSQKQAIADSFQSITTAPSALFEKPALKGAVEYAQERTRLASAAFTKQVVFLLQIVFSDPQAYYGTGMDPCDDLGAGVPTLSESASNGRQSVPPVQTYVIAINFWPPPLAQSDTLNRYNETAFAGGTEAAYITSVFNNETLAKKMQDARTAAVACEFSLPPATSNLNIDPQTLGLSFTSSGQLIPRVENEAGCSADGGALDGWHFDEAVPPTKIITCPEICKKIKSAQMPEETVTINVSCPSSP
jgi:hypothetical protein